MVCYCSKACQDKDLFQHKKDCEGLLRELVERAGKTLREMFYVFAEGTFDTSVVNVTKEPDGILVFERPNDVRQTGQVLFEFPMVPSPDLRDRNAVFCVKRSEHAVAFLSDVLSSMLEGKYSCGVFSFDAGSYKRSRYAVDQIRGSVSAHAGSSKSCHLALRRS